MKRKPLFYLKIYNFVLMVSDGFANVATQSIYLAENHCVTCSATTRSVNCETHIDTHVSGNCIHNIRDI